MSHPLRFWHPVLRSRDLRRRPVPVRLLDRPVVLFRDADGLAGALDDVCPHRRMRLSLGAVRDGRLECPYHRWSFDRQGCGRVPASPRQRPRATAWDVAERDGALWIRQHDEPAPFPLVDLDGLRPAGVLRHRVRAPLELVLDNFCEVEHTPAVHALLGYAEDAMADVDVQVTATADAVRVTNRGRQKPLPAVVERLFGIRAGDTFCDDWTTRFDPVHAVYDHYWLAPTGTPRPDRLRTAVFFVPASDTVTDLISFTATSTPILGRLGLNLIVPAVLRLLVDREIRLDVRTIESIADPRPELQGMTLGRFDKALAENRRRLDAIYRGQGPVRAFR